MSESSVSIDPGFPDLNDADILKIEAVLDVLQAKYSKTSVLLDDFPRETKERFWNAGYEVRVDMYDTNIEGVYIPDITIQGRVEGEFDPDQMVWEATNDILDLGEGGVIKSDGGTKTPRGLILPKKG